MACSLLNLSQEVKTYYRVNSLVVKDGESISYGDEGKLLSVFNYTKGSLDGIYGKYIDGQLDEVGRFSNGVIVPKDEYQEGDSLLTPDVEPFIMGCNELPFSEAYRCHDKEMFRLGMYVEYPKVDRQLGVEGLVEVVFIVNEQGKTENFQIIEAPSETLAQSVIDEIRGFKSWSPAKLNGKAVKAQRHFRMNFQLRR